MAVSYGYSCTGMGQNNNAMGRAALHEMAVRWCCTGRKRTNVSAQSRCLQKLKAKVLCSPARRWSPGDQMVATARRALSMPKRQALTQMHTVSYSEVFLHLKAKTWPRTAIFKWGEMPKTKPQFYYAPWPIGIHLHEECNWRLWITLLRSANMNTGTTNSFLYYICKPSIPTIWVKTVKSSQKS